jgi:endonuclease/exonuclease/phosphatase (EEP) superfamily protein YafD
MGKRVAIVVLSACAVALALVSALPFVAGHTWLVEIASHFRVQYLAVSVLIAVGLAVLGCRHRAVAMLPIAAINALVVAPHALPQAQAVVEGPSLKLLIVNLAADNHRFEDLLTIVAREQPDIAVLAEFTPHAAAALRPLRAHLQYSREIARVDAWGIALLSRLPIEDARIFDLGDTPAIDARLSGPQGEVRLLGVHLLPPTTARWFAARNAQLDALAALTAGGTVPLIVAGDFNLSPYSAYFGRWIGASGLHDTLAGQGLDFTWPSGFPPLGIPIDHAFVSDEFSVLSRRRLERFGSDHLPVLIELIQE